MKLAVRWTAGVDPPENYHGCSTPETSKEELMNMKLISRRASMDGKRKNRLKVCKKDCDVETFLEFPCKSDLGLSKDVGTSTGSQWEFSTTATPKQKSKRMRHGKGPAKMPKREKFSSRRIAHEARLWIMSKPKGSA